MNNESLIKNLKGFTSGSELIAVGDETFAMLSGVRDSKALSCEGLFLQCKTNEDLRETLAGRRTLEFVTLDNLRRRKRKEQPERIPMTMPGLTDILDADLDSSVQVFVSDLRGLHKTLTRGHKGRYTHQSEYVVRRNGTYYDIGRHVSLQLTDLDYGLPVGAYPRIAFGLPWAEDDEVVEVGMLNGTLVVRTQRWVYAVASSADDKAGWFSRELRARRLTAERLVEYYLAPAPEVPGFYMSGKQLRSLIRQTKAGKVSKLAFNLNGKAVSFTGYSLELSGPATIDLTVELPFESDGFVRCLDPAHIESVIQNMGVGAKENELVFIEFVEPRAETTRLSYRNKTAIIAGMLA